MPGRTVRNPCTTTDSRRPKGWPHCDALRTREASGALPSMGRQSPRCQTSRGSGGIAPCSVEPSATPALRLIHAGGKYACTLTRCAQEKHRARPTMGRQSPRPWLGSRQGASRHAHPRRSTSPRVGARLRRRRAQENAACMTGHGGQSPRVDEIASVVAKEGGLGPCSGLPQRLLVHQPWQATAWDSAPTPWLREGQIAHDRKGRRHNRRR